MSTLNSGASPARQTVGGRDRRACAIAMIRIIVGVVFLLHGGQKLFVFGVHNVAGMMGHMGIPIPIVAAAVVTWVEFLGGAALILGLFTRIAALLLAFDMLVAVLKVHLSHGFFAPMGFEFPLTLLIANLALAIGGSGSLAIDNLLFWRRS